MSAPASDSRPLLKDRAYAHIKGRILDGTFASGQFISERELSEDLEMSKTPIRAAIERLADQGFVTIAPQRGVIVRQLSPKEISDHYDIRTALEMFVVRSIAGRLTAEQKRLLEQNLELQRSLVAGEVDVVGFTRADAEFHLLMCQFHGNHEIIRSMKRQRERVHRVVETIAFHDVSIPPLSVAEHEDIYAAVRDGEGDEAAHLVEKHLVHGKHFLLLGGDYGNI